MHFDIRGDELPREGLGQSEQFELPLPDPEPLWNNDWGRINAVCHFEL